MKYYERYESYKHIPLDDAEQSFKAGQRQRYRVTTINWTYADGNPKEVHRNTYVWTLAQLIEFIRTTDVVAEDVIGLELVR